MIFGRVMEIAIRRCVAPSRVQVLSPEVERFSPESNSFSPEVHELSLEFRPPSPPPHARHMPRTRTQPRAPLHKKATPATLAGVTFTSIIIHLPLRPIYIQIPDRLRLGSRLLLLAKQVLPLLAGRQAQWLHPPSISSRLPALLQT